MGRKNNHFIAGMPGNPVSSFVMFEMLLKPLLNKLMGISGESNSLQVPIASDYERQKTDTLLFIPVSFNSDGEAVPLEYHGSAHIHAYSKAGGIMEVPMGISNLYKDDLVYVRPI
jgi:molybdopterin molybdotransferase